MLPHELRGVKQKLEGKSFPVTTRLQRRGGAWIGRGRRGASGFRLVWLRTGEFPRGVLRTLFEGLEAEAETEWRRALFRLGGELSRCRCSRGSRFSSRSLASG